MQTRIKVAFGGSHRKNTRCVNALKPFLADTLILPAGLNSKRLEATVFDSPEMRTALKAMGGSVKRFQPSWLNRPD